MKGRKNTNLSPIPHSGGFSSFLLGILAVLLFFVILQESAPHLKSNFRPLKMKSTTDSEIKWEISPIPDYQKKPKFVEANPNIPDNLPDKVEQFSFRNQQAAQPEKNDEIDSANTPKFNQSNDGHKVAEKNKEVKLLKPPLPPQSIPENISKQVSKIPQKSNPSKSKLIPKSNALGIHSKEKMGKNANINRKLVASLQTHNPSFPSHPSASQPRPYQKTRPKLSTDLIHGPLMKSKTSAPRLGQIAIECRLHPYGVYIQEMLQSIEEQWNQLASGSIQFLQQDRLPGKITLRFKLEANGRIKNLSRIDNEGYSLAAELCRQAIASRVPFGKWTEKMINDFGQSDEITISFQYH